MINLIESTNGYSKYKLEFDIDHYNVHGEVNGKKGHYQLVITYNTHWLICKYFPSICKLKKWLNENERYIYETIDFIRHKVFAYEYYLVEQFSCKEDGLYY